MSDEAAQAAATAFAAYAFRAALALKDIATVSAKAAASAAADHAAFAGMRYRDIQTVACSSKALLQSLHAVPCHWSSLLI